MVMNVKSTLYFGKKASTSLKNHVAVNVDTVYVKFLNFRTSSLVWYNQILVRTDIPSFVWASHESCDTSQVYKLWTLKY